MNTGEVNQPREDVKALIMENRGLREDVKRLRDEMAEKQRKSDAEINDIKAEMKKLTQANELKCKFVFQLISFHPHS